MGRSKRTFPPGNRRDWLAPDHPARERPWAYEEVLFGTAESGRQEALTELFSSLARDLAELERLHRDVLDQIERVAALQGRVQVLMQEPDAGPAGRAEEPSAEGEIRSFPDEPSRAALEAVPLTRCGGFRVDSPDGTVGFVEGLRFASRIDRPDLLEVRGGRFGRELLLIPVEAVEEISPDEERLVLRSPLRLRDDPVHELVGRLRRVLHSAGL